MTTKLTDVSIVVMAPAKALFLRNMPPEIVREAKATAARRGETLTAFVAKALARSLSAPEEPPPEADALQRDMQWYRTHRSSLGKRYLGQYVAILDGEVVDHGRDFGPLAARVFARFGNRSVYMPRVQADEPTAKIRSPRSF